LIKSWDYLKEYKKIKRNLLKKIDKTFSSGNLILGPEVEKFEKNFRKFIGAKYGIGVGNCTDAIYIALKSLNIGHGDEVITVSNTAIPTITAIVNAGAKPKFVDIKDNYLIDENKIEKAINKKTKALIVVHLYGLSCNMNFINKIKKKYKIKIIEDCAQSTGATYYKKKTGNIGDVGCFSFYPTKVLGAYGDGGFITTNDKKIFHNLKLKRFMGIENNEKSKNK
jgi:dTDP-4-amino-4,6-dideoxygalactose transaminase